MGTTVDKFGKYIEGLVENKPLTAQKRIVQAYEIFGFCQRCFPDKNKDKSLQYLADVCNEMMVRCLKYPDKTFFVSLFTPCELLYAFDLNTLCAEMYATFLNGAASEAVFIKEAEDKGISESFCSYHKVVIGALLSKVLPRFRGIVNTSVACDANNLTFRKIGHDQGIGQYYIDVPYEKNDEAISYVRDELIELSKILERETGKKLDNDKLYEITLRSKETIKLMMDSLVYRKSRSLHNDLTSELYEALLMHTALGSDEALNYARMRLEDLEKAEEFNGLKILWMHTNPFYLETAKRLFNFQKEREIVATELSYENWRIIEEDDPFSYMAKRLVYSSYNGSLDDRLEQTFWMADELDADGIICFCQWGCKEASGAAKLMQRKISEKGYPVLMLDGDGVNRNNSANSQSETRLEAFIEMLEERNK